ncbi:MAG: hypothetical protein NTX53_16445 [candidate division WOR-3 bacterium]|nr:hypothetical protein [candidate division WOR-3 bacterium]
MKETADQLQAWAKAKRRCRLTDAHVQMARELRMNPQRLAESAGAAQGLTPTPLAQRIENLYLRRFKKPQPDSIIPLRQMLHDARVRERDEARELRRRKHQAKIDHAEAARVSMLTLRRLYGGLGSTDDAFMD